MIDTIINGVDSIVGKFIPDQTKAKELTNQLNVLVETSITERHKNDMASTSKMSKSIRPILTYSLFGLFILCLVIDCFIGVEIKQGYLDILQTLLAMAIGFYFGGRTLEKFRR